MPDASKLSRLEPALILAAAPTVFAHLVATVVGSRVRPEFAYLAVGSAAIAVLPRRCRVAALVGLGAGSLLRGIFLGNGVDSGSEVLAAVVAFAAAAAAFFHARLGAHGALMTSLRTVTRSGQVRRRSTEADLTLARADYERLVETSQDLIWEVDEEGRWTFLNRRATRRIYGREPEEMLGHRFIEYLHPSQIEADLETFRAIKSGEVRTQYETVHVRGDGSPVSLSFNAVPRYDAEGRVLGTSGTATDLTERKAAEARRSDLERSLQEARRLESLGVMAGGIAHDFNNLLLSIVGNAQLAVDAASGEPTVARSLAAILRASEDASDLVQQLLAYAGKGRRRLTSVDLSRIAADLRPVFEERVCREAALVVDLAADLPKIEGDSVQLGRVILNLAFNAAEAIGDGPGTVTIRTRRETGRESCVVLEVADDGPGMSEEVRARVFEPFFSTKFAGRGLGLAASHGIVLAHGGRIEVRSEPGKGTVFSVFLPILRTSRIGLSAESEAHQ